MGVTAIKQVFNESSGIITILDVENPGAKGHGEPIDSGGHLDVEMWVPWAPEEHDFAHHHLELQRGGQTSACIWQADKHDGDFVRWSADQRWADPGDLAPGTPLVDGDRWLTVTDEGFELSPAGGHGVTAITAIENLSQSGIQLFDLESPGVVGHAVEVQPGERYAPVGLDMWIPWAPSRRDFDPHHLELRYAGETKFSIWQAKHPDGDFVRYAEGANWENPGTPMPGLADAQGNRWLRVFDDHIELVAELLEGTKVSLIRVDNKATKPVAVFDLWNKGAPNSGLVIQPNDSLDVDIWIPWAWNADVFPARQLRVAVGDNITVDAGTRWWIWHAARADGDFIRYSTDGQWHDPGQVVPGDSAAGYGSRALTVRDDGIELVVVPTKLPQPFDHGNWIIGLAKKPAPNGNELEGSSSQAQQIISTVTNTAKDTAGVPMDLRLQYVENGTWRRIGPVDVAPGQGVADFAGLNMFGAWNGFAPNISAVLVPETAYIEVAWSLDRTAGSPYRIEFVEKDTAADADRVIQAVGGRNADGSVWQLPVDEVIANLQAGDRYFIDDGNVRAYMELGRSGRGRPYLKTVGDPETPNLLSLPGFP